MRIEPQDEFYKEPKLDYGKIAAGCLAGILLVLLAAAFFLFTGEQKKKTLPQKDEDLQATVSEDLILSEGGEIRAEDLDFWNMYEDSELEKRPDYKEAEESAGWSEDYGRNMLSVSENEQEAKGIVSADSISENMFDCADSGEAELLEINPDIPKNTYRPEGFRQEESELQYYSSGRKVSTYGVDVSKYQGDIDWEAVRDCGIDFAMLRAGVRGYSTGSVVMDESFEKNAKEATENGIDIGIYFYSQAINLNEAVEEANYAVAAASKYSVIYPIVFYTESIENDSARTDSLTEAERTDIAAAFCSTVEAYGFRSMICGSKHQLSKGLELEKISGRSLWLIDAPKMKEGDRLEMSAFPYKYSMWQYSNMGQIDGIEGNCNLDISFVDYHYN